MKWIALAWNMEEAFGIPNVKYNKKKGCCVMKILGNVASLLHNAETWTTLPSPLSVGSTDYLVIHLHLQLQLSITKPVGFKLQLDKCSITGSDSELHDLVPCCPWGLSPQLGIIWKFRGFCSMPLFQCRQCGDVRLQGWCIWSEKWAP